MSIRSDETLALGKRLVDELDLAKSVDTLGRWMAHHIAQLILDAEQAEGEERTSKMQACREAIISLWEHRRALPNGQRPFEELEPILRAVATLDPDEEASRHFPLALAKEAEGEPVDPVRQWLKAARDVDYMARILIRECLAHAADDAYDKSAEWVALANAAAMEERQEAVVLRLIAEERELSAASFTDEAADELRTRIERLRTFGKLATELSAELEQRAESRKARGQSNRNRPVRPMRAGETRGAPRQAKSMTKKKAQPRTKTSRKARAPTPAPQRSPQRQTKKRKKARTQIAASNEKRERLPTTKLRKARTSKTTRKR